MDQNRQKRRGRSVSGARTRCSARRMEAVVLQPKRAATSPEPPPELGRRAARGLGAPTFERARRHTDAVEQIRGRVSARSVEEPVEDPCQAVVAKERRRVVVEDGRDHESRECILLHAVPPAAVEVTDVTQRQHDVRRGEARGLRGGDRREREDLGSERPERRRSDDDAGVGEQGLVREVVRGSSARWGVPPGSEPIDVVGCCSTRIEIERPVVVVGSDLLAGADLEADGVDQCSECVAHHHEHVVRIAPRRSTSGDLCRGGITPPGLGRGQDGGTAP